MPKQYLLPRVISTITQEIEESECPEDVVFKGEEYLETEIQILRSSSTWSAGIGETEHSILNSYIGLGLKIFESKYDLKVLAAKNIALVAQYIIDPN